MLYTFQYGFRSRRSTLSQLKMYNHALAVHALKGCFTHSVYIDFKLAFDSISLNKLISKMASFGIIGRLQKWLSALILIVAFK